MRNRIIVIGAIVLVAFWFGSRANRPVIKQSKGETARKMWNDPHARKSRKKLGKKIAKAAKKHR
ncbi:hypothetical protein EDF24_0614 [Curtobacterium sp. PhB130]|uniref:hypothetical protein n=1 Tax=unclassified Curtobacterium TaxID=257496 RepID=UPI000F4C7A53|nr:MULTISPECIES: hypothetical protein [unclassified Curtobacterium]ROP63590.1 hypothetical protein EDF55_2350 [Curtobacterium sp. ZW137]ROS77850.1 hypothetical protein EDF24_0614 [Curtobacterium sp. PhB130]TCK65934.1 hypothetical protein EDF27_0683 [Curtobacterium sp. PhB136]